MNPYIKLLGSTAIMSGSEEKTLNVSPNLTHRQSWFLKQNEELLKLFDSLCKQDVQEEEILDRISDFMLVLFEYVKTLKKRKEGGAVCV